MKKVFKLEDLDCANCAAKIETAINNMPEVTSATVNFMTQKLSLEIEDDQFGPVIKKVQKVIKKVEPDCTIVL